MEYRQSRVISGRGSAADQFANSLAAICLDRQDRIFAAGDSQVKVFDAGGKLLRSWNISKPALAIAIAPDSSVWVGEAEQVEVFGVDGRPLRTWRDDGRLARVTAIGFFKDNVLVAESKDRCIRRYDRTLKFLNNIGKDNRMDGFLIPNGALDFSVDSTGVIHVANPGKHRVERYTLDDKLLGHIGHFDGLNPSGFGGCCNPTNVIVGSSGWTYVTEKADPRAKVLDSEGKLLGVIADSIFDPSAKNMDIALDSRGHVYVADTAKLKILVFEPVAGKGVAL